jgi:hypothetical protein
MSLFQVVFKLKTLLASQCENQNMQMFVHCENINVQVT